MYLPGYCDPALIYLMAGIANNFERIKVRVLCGVYRSQVRDTIEFSPDEQSQFDHGGPAEGGSRRFAVEYAVQIAESNERRKISTMGRWRFAA